MKPFWPGQVYEYVEEYEPNDEFSECVMADIGDDFSYRNSGAIFIILDMRILKVV